MGKKDRLSGFNPATGQFERSVNVADLKRNDPDLGSIPGGWSMECSDQCTVFPLDGSDPWRIPAWRVISMSRSANGLLVAFANGTDRIHSVWNMKTREPVLRLAPPLGARFYSMAFSWKGDKLWLLSRNDQSQLFLQTWDIPPTLQDPATQGTYPDQNITKRN